MRVKRRILFIGLVTLLLVALPLAALATHRFRDVRDNATHRHGINYVADTGITIGCNAEGTLFCPRDNLTREQMATFLFRSSGWDPNTPPSVNALNTLLVNGQLVFSDLEDFEVSGGSVSECLDAGDLGSGVPMDIVFIQQQLTNAPMDVADVNVALKVDRGNQNGEYQVCFRSLDGGNLTGGTYETNYTITIDVLAVSALGTAGADDSGITEEAARAAMAHKLGQ